jgi:D-beta-D-heptose 7-phosphate kinase/D-beta-D-heptose 1-phosphate adenosyltransferase
MKQILQEILGDGSKKKIKVLVVGDIIYDEYIWGNIERISPEAPIPVLEWLGDNSALGGAANVAHNLSQLGAQVYLVGVIGGDERGHKLKELLRNSGIKTKGVITDPKRPTTCKTRILAHNQQILRIDKELIQPISNQIEKQILRHIMGIGPEMCGIIVSDYLKGLLSESLLEQLISMAKEWERLVVVDPKGRDFSKYRGAYALTPNIKETEIASGMRIMTDEDLENAAKRLFQLLNCHMILVTRGKDGLSLFQEKKLPTHVPTEAKEVYDVTGAGDTVISLFSLSLFRGYDPINAAHLANAGAGIVVGKLGTSPISRRELEDFLTGQSLYQSKKILSLSELLPIANLARAQGKTIVFTNGCFDLLHVGHIQYLQKAKALGDILIIGLNDDNSVRSLKGDPRPLIGQEERANILAALGCIDYIIIFSELTPGALIRNIKPSILVKGGDYTLDQVVGRDIVESYGGRTEIIPYMPGYSTSGLIEKIVQNYV